MAKYKSACICINIMSELSHLELLEYDSGRGSFLHLDSEDFMFDPATREPLDDEEHFQTLIKRLYDRNKIPYKHPTVVVVPSFFTRQYTIPEDVLGEDLKTILISEAERFYVFKKIDPEVGYCSIKDNQVLYTAYPKEPLEFIRRVFTNLKIPVASIDCNYTAALRGLVAMGVVQSEVNNMVKWGMMLVSDYSVFMMVVEGSTVEKTLESPLPLQNVEEEALLNQIKEDFQQFFGFEVLSRVVIINNSQKLYSPTLVEQLGFEGATDVFDQNDRTLSSRGAVEAPFPCTLEAIGGALVKVVEDIPPMELSDVDVLEAMFDQERKDKIAYIIIALGVLLFGLQWGIGTLATSLTDSESKNGTEIQTSINNALNSLTLVPEVKRKQYVRDGVEQNKKISNLLIKVHAMLPSDSWLNTVTIKSTNDFKSLELNITGSALTTEPLNDYVKELNNEVGTPPLTPKIVPKQQDEQRYADFELSNITGTGAPR